MVQVAAIQMVSTHDIDANLEEARRLLAEAWPAFDGGRVLVPPLLHERDDRLRAGIGDSCPQREER